MTSGIVAIAPSRGRRLAMIVAYLAACFVVYGVALAFLPWACLEKDQCTATQSFAAHALTILWLIASLAIAIAGWRGLLPGARIGPRPAARP